MTGARVSVERTSLNGSGTASARSALLTARVLSQTSKTVLYAALFVASAESISATRLSAIVLAMMAGAILFAIPAGVVVDRIGPARALTTGTLLRLVAAIAAVTAVVEPGYAWVAALVFSAASQPFTQAELAVVRDAQPECPNGTHASIVVLQHVGQGTGLLIAPLLYLAAGAGGIVAGAIALHLLTLPVTLHLERRLRDTGLPWRHQTTPKIDLSGTLRFFAQQRRARYAAGTLAYGDLASKSLLIAAPVYFAGDLNLSNGAVAALVVTIGAGVLLGLLWSGRMLSIALAPHALRSVVLVAIASSLTLAGFGVALGSAVHFSGLGALPLLSTLEDGSQPSLALAFPAVFALGAALSIAPVAARTLLTETAPPSEQARVFASVATLSDISVILPLALAGVGAELIGARPTLLLVGLLGALLLAHFELVDPETEHAERTPAASLPPA